MATFYDLSQPGGEGTSLAAVFTDAGSAATAIDHLAAHGFIGDVIGVAMSDPAQQRTLVSSQGVKQAHGPIAHALQVGQLSDLERMFTRTGHTESAATDIAGAFHRGAVLLTLDAGDRVDDASRIVADVLPGDPPIILRY